VKDISDSALELGQNKVT